MKSVKIILIALLIFIVLSVVSIAAFYLPQSNESTEETGKPYRITNIRPNLFSTIAYKVLRPILEERIDYYIEQNLLNRLQNAESSENPINNLPRISSQDIVQGSGPLAMCGNNVELKIIQLNDSDPNKVAALILNQQAVNYQIGKILRPELNEAIIGMQKGGQKIVTIRDAKNLYAPPQMYYIHLVEMTNNYPSQINNLITFDNQSRSGADKNRVVCGNTVSVSYTLRRHDGSISKVGDITFQVGSAQVPLAFEFGVLNMAAGNRRSVISPPELLKTNANMLIDELDVDHSNISIIDLEITSQL